MQATFTNAIIVAMNTFCVSKPNVTPMVDVAVATVVDIEPEVTMTNYTNNLRSAIFDAMNSTLTRQEHQQKIPIGYVRITEIVPNYFDGTDDFGIPSPTGTGTPPEAVAGVIVEVGDGI